MQVSAVRFTHQIDDLADDLLKIAKTTRAKMVKPVRDNLKLGNRLAQGFAREASGPHGLNAWKRLSHEMLTPLSGEFGWTGDAEAIVGAGWRNGATNHDLPKAADIVGPKLSKDAGDVLDTVFWPGA